MPRTASFALKPTRPLKLTEAQVTRQICDFLAIRNWVLIRCHVGVFVPLRVAKQATQEAAAGRAHRAQQLLSRNAITGCDEGTTDWVAVHSEFPCIWIEMKASRGRLRPRQQYFIDYMRDKRGFHVGHWNSLDSFISFYHARIDAR
jgi:hypothetical protein